MSISTLDSVIEYLESVPKRCEHGLDAGELYNRAENAIAHADGKITFEVVRHQRVGGIPRRNMPMAALLNQRCLYTFDPEVRELLESPIGEPYIDESQWDWNQLTEDTTDDLSFKFENLEKGIYRMTE